MATPAGWPSGFFRAGGCVTLVAMDKGYEAQLEERGAILRGHFQFASGRHGDTYIEKFRILQWPDITGNLCEGIAGHFRGAANLVAGPTTGGRSNDACGRSGTSRRASRAGQTTGPPAENA